MHKRDDILRFRIRTDKIGQMSDQQMNLLLNFPQLKVNAASLSILHYPTSFLFEQFPRSKQIHQQLSNFIALQKEADLQSPIVRHPKLNRHSVCFLLTDIDKNPYFAFRMLTPALVMTDARRFGSLTKRELENDQTVLQFIQLDPVLRRDDELYELIYTIVLSTIFFYGKNRNIKNFSIVKPSQRAVPIFQRFGFVNEASTEVYRLNQFSNKASSIAEPYYRLWQNRLEFQLPDYE